MCCLSLLSSGHSAHIAAAVSAEREREREREREQQEKEREKEREQRDREREREMRDRERTNEYIRGGALLYAFCLFSEQEVILYVLFWNLSCVCVYQVDRNSQVGQEVEDICTPHLPHSGHRM